jgi:uncharacterized RDD family membrane protein YckC
MVCPTCGKEQVGDPAFCPNCGAKFIQESGTQPGVAYASVVTYAGFWRRFAAALLDGILINIVSGVASFIIGLIVGVSFSGAGTDEDTAYGAAFLIAILVSLGISWVYYALMESSSKQATLGKMALGIIVTDNQGRRISFGRATGRYFAKFISMLILFIGYLMIAFTEKKQGLHDMIADTLVVLK